jgi:outer membrane lipoprotein-sorting protein
MLSLLLSRGRTSGHSSAALLILAGLAVAGSPAWAQDEKLPSGEKIMEKSIEGLGGREAFEKLNSRVSKGTIEATGGAAPQKGTVTVYEAAPNLRYFLLELPGGVKVQAGSDGDVFWELAAEGPKIFEGEERAQREREATFNSLLRWKDLYQKVECVGKEQVDGHSCYKVVLTPFLGNPETVYFDRKNGYPIRLDTVRKITNAAGAQLELQLQIRREDYRQVDGVWLPHKLVRHVDAMGQTQVITYTWESIEHNADIPADRFDLPPQVKELKDGSGKKPARPGPKGPPA